MTKYKLIKPDTEKLEKFKVTIKGDSNDADYITEEEVYTKEEFELVVGKLRYLMYNFGGSHQLEEFDEDEYDEEYAPEKYVSLSLPHSEYGICHTLEEVKIEYLDKDGKLWKVEIFE